MLSLRSELESEFFSAELRVSTIFLSNIGCPSPVKSFLLSAVSLPSTSANFVLHLRAMFLSDFVHALYASTVFFILPLREKYPIRFRKLGTFFCRVFVLRSFSAQAISGGLPRLRLDGVARRLPLKWVDVAGVLSEPILTSLLFKPPKMGVSGAEHNPLLSSADAPL